MNDLTPFVRIAEEALAKATELPRTLPDFLEGLKEIDLLIHARIESVREQIADYEGD